MQEVTPAEIARPVVKKAMAKFRKKIFAQTIESGLSYFLFDLIDARFFAETEQKLDQALFKAFGIDFTGEMKIVSTDHDSIGFIKGERLDRFLEGESA